MVAPLTVTAGSQTGSHPTNSLPGLRTGMDTGMWPRPRTDLNKCAEPADLRVPTSAASPALRRAESALYG
jgi:hypothetical protein